jgi:molybdate transport system substrate-binding protein
MTSTAVRLGVFLVCALGALAHAAEIKVLSTIGVRSLVEELAPQFNQQTGHKLVITFGIANVLKKQIEAGEPFDLSILTAAAADNLIKQGKLDAATHTNVARDGIGIAVCAGAPRPDIGSVEALKRVLLDIKSIAYSKGGRALHGDLPTAEYGAWLGGNQAVERG